MRGGHERNLLPSGIRPADPLGERAQARRTTDPLPGGFDDDVPHDGRTFPRDVAQPVRASRGVLTRHHPEVAADRSYSVSITDDPLSLRRRPAATLARIPSPGTTTFHSTRRAGRPTSRRPRSPPRSPLARRGAVHRAALQSCAAWPAILATHGVLVPRVPLPHRRLATAQSCRFVNVTGPARQCGSRSSSECCRGRRPCRRPPRAARTA